MNIAITLVILAALALVFVLRFAIVRGLQRDSYSLQVQAVDVQAFRNLISPAENEYLRQRLPAADFRRVQRERLRATAAYIQEVSGNAAQLIRIGEAALASGDSRTAQAGGELVNNAILIRRNASFALLRIYVALVWPYGTAGVGKFVDNYERLSGTAMLLGRLQNPAIAFRPSAH